MKDQVNKWTPGAWVARPDPNGGPNDACIGLDDDTSPVDYVAVCHARDASVIAAAKELYEALVAARAEIAGLPRSLGYDIDSLPMIDAVLKKARGDA